MRRAIYPGYFDPFTNGHLDIVKKSAALFDEVYVVIGVNSQKRRTFEAEGMRKAIVVIRYDGKYLVLNGKTPEDTKAIYETLNAK